MSVFSVEAVLKERPEIWGILGKKMIRNLRHAGVSRITPGFLSDRGYESPCFVISHDGLLLAKVTTGLSHEMFSWLFPKSENMLAAIRRVGAENVAYIAQYDFGCDDVGAPCALYIYKVPAQGLNTLIQSFSQEAEQEVLS